MSDVLSDILDTVDMKATIYFRTEFHTPFGIEVPQFRRAARFHLIIQGQCYVRLKNGTNLLAMPGDLVFVPNGESHLLSSDPSGDCRPLSDLMTKARFEGQGPFVVGKGAANKTCQMVCGHFDFAEGADHQVLHAVPEILHISAADRATQPMLDDVMRLIVRRAFAAGSGASASITRLSEILFIEVMRASLTQLGGETPIMVAVNDHQIGRALAAIHGNITKNWTVDSLAQTAGMSRTRFSERFRELVGSSPMAYVAEWRLQRALWYLGNGKQPVKVIAGEVGFRSVAAFSRAFRARFGRAPRERRESGMDA
ncbi:MAG: cupin domain-containing protein [Sphingorhabdus sp.]|uniref:AraC family transcriptional regulator n=1 Tax=Sphingorhabdus sp. TaxID=1902408 RepID=UPI0038FCD87A